MKTRECPNCRALLVQASTVCSTCGAHVGGSSLPPPAVPRPAWLDDVQDGTAGGTAAVEPPPPPGAGADLGPPTPPGGWIDAGPPPPPPPGGVGGPPPPTAAGGAPGWGGAGGPGTPGGPGAPYGYAPSGYAPYGYAPRQTHPQATTAMVLGILSLVVCGLLGIPAVVIGNRVRREIQASGGRLDGESSARTGVICGWVGLALTAIGVLALFAVTLLGTTVETEPTFETIPVDAFELPPIDELPTPTTR